MTLYAYIPVVYGMPHERIDAKRQGSIGCTTEVCAKYFRRAIATPTAGFIGRIYSVVGNVWRRLSRVCYGVLSPSKYQ